MAHRALRDMASGQWPHTMPLTHTLTCRDCKVLQQLTTTTTKDDNQRVGPAPASRQKKSIKTKLNTIKKGEKKPANPNSVVVVEVVVVILSPQARH